MQKLKDRKLSEATRVRIYAADAPVIKQIANVTEYNDVAVTRMAIHLGLLELAKKHKIKLPSTAA